MDDAGLTNEGHKVGRNPLGVKNAWFKGSSFCMKGQYCVLLGWKRKRFEAELTLIPNMKDGLVIEHHAFSLVSILHIDR